MVSPTLDQKEAFARMRGTPASVYLHAMLEDSRIACEKLTGDQLLRAQGTVATIRRIIDMVDGSGKQAQP